MINVCINPACHNPARDGKRTCQPCADAARNRKRARERVRTARKRVYSNTLCAEVGCTKVHHARSPYCLEHIKAPRGKHNTGQTGTLQLAREILNADDLPQTLHRPEEVWTCNLKTFKWSKEEI